ncbi:hypothetical protein ACFQJ7_08530 [Halovenus rubra]|uniref:Uncharacterized protein n=2 Tax=Halovenus rubra TaxID=869890 RepID=A0ACC7E5N2_9EURY|nr:hypothetical protein [Halovenus rubra]
MTACDVCKFQQAERLSAGQTDASIISVDELVADEVYSLRHGACNPASSDLLERDPEFVRLIGLHLPVTAFAHQRRLSPDQ